MLRVVLFLVLLGAVVWAVFWVIDRRRQASGPGDAPGSGGRPAPRRPQGPDDDEDFLRELDRKRRHQRPKPPVEPPPSSKPETGTDGSTSEGDSGAQTDENA